MLAEINYQYSGLEDTIHATVCDSCEFEKWCAEYLRPRVPKLYVVMSGRTYKNVFITAWVSEIEMFFDFMFDDDILFIQEFEADDYEDALGYLTDLFEATEEPPAPIIPPFGLS